MDKIDFRKDRPALYAPRADDFSLVKVPKLVFVKVDGKGDPNKAADYERGLNWVYSVSYAIKFASKEQGRDYVVPPLEALWWADDMEDFVRRRKDNWRWTQMLMVPDWATKEMYAAAVKKAAKKLGEPPQSLRLEDYDEGLAVQIMHIGSYDDEGPTIKRLHETFLPANGLVENGPHHEIYLSDPRKTDPKKLKTILRQPVKQK